jgi:hypothetical protein
MTLTGRHDLHGSREGLSVESFCRTSMTGASAFGKLAPGGTMPTAARFVSGSRS